MTENCNIIRDLIPLVIDDAASEDSKKCVETHLAACEGCRICYDAMQSAFTRIKAREEDQKAFEKAAQILRKKRRRRILRNIIIGILIGCLLCYGGLIGWSHLKTDYNQLIYHGNYGVTLSELKDGQVSVNIDYYGSHLVCGVDLENVQENGRNILYVYLERPIIKQYMMNPHNNYSCTRLSPERMEELYEIRQGKGDEYLVVWQKGMDIPDASEEMNHYFALNEEYLALWNAQDQTPDGKLMIRSQEDYEQIELLRDQLRQITVPEWQ